MPPIDVGGYEAQRFFATSPRRHAHPYTLIYRKGWNPDGRTPRLDLRLRFLWHQRLYPAFA